MGIVGNVASGEAPGRLDFMGGVADYSGSLVLQTPIEGRTRVEITPLTAPVVRLESASQSGTFEILLAQLEALRERPPTEWRAWLGPQGIPHWALYVVGCLGLFAREMSWHPTSGLTVRVESQVPTSMGVSSSAALEVATLCALENLTGLRFAGTALAKLAQRAENEVVGAPCGLMDQLASAHGQPGALLPILCRPDLLSEPIPLPSGVVVAGWPSGVRHAVADSPYATARTGAFMAKKMLEEQTEEKVDYLSEFRLEHTAVPLPEQMRGAEFLSRFVGVDDLLSRVEPERLYPVRAAGHFGIEENDRCETAMSLLRASDDSAMLHSLGELMYASHAAYSAMGLGHSQTDAMVAAVRELGPSQGFYGARVSGGGAGGTVVVLADQAALQRLQNLDGLPRQLIR